MYDFYTIGYFYKLKKFIYHNRKENLNDVKDKMQFKVPRSIH